MGLLRHRNPIPLKAGVSRIRNRVIVRVLRELGLVEEWGTGRRAASSFSSAHRKRASIGSQSKHSDHSCEVVVRDDTQ
jgi:predicted HTH transcriptional regulator